MMSEPAIPGGTAARHPTDSPASTTAPGSRPVSDRRGRVLRDLRVSVIDRCNFRCNYCMPKEVFGVRHRFMAPDEWLTPPEIIRIVRVLVTVFGVDKVHLTGGEPLLRPGLPALVGALAEIPGLHEIVLTTNGSRMTKQLARDLRAAGLTRATVSLDALDDATFQRMNGVGFPVKRVLEAMDAVEEAGLPPVQVNMVVRRGYNDEAVIPMAAFFRGTGRVLRFIEFMDVGTVNGWRREDVVEARDILARIQAVWPVVPVPASRPGQTARRYRYRDGAGEIGLIASVTEPFCGACNRLRLTADGKFYTCLFQSTGHDVRAVLRGGGGDDDLEQFVRDLWTRRDDQYSVDRLRIGRKQPHPIEMYQIGG
jgi:cyclic pyranopterin phosphate synthase